MIRTGPHSGLNSDFVTSSMYIGDSLPEGLRLGEYEIQSVIGEGGFGIVYLAYDHFLQRQVALKEYMPSSLAGRSRMGLDVTIKSERHRDTFQAGLKSFINEARLLAQFDHRALVKVYRFWEGNGTAYMVMPYVVGPTLKAALAEMPAPPDEAWLRGQVLTPLMEALSLLHKASCLHRDIAPDNILLTETGPMLLDFGAARKVIGDLNQTLTVVLKPGYAPIEQYGEVAALTQGPWTDVYALGGVVRYAITGKVPVSATTRLVQDTMVPLSQLAAGQYSEGFLQAVDVALAVKPVDRPQDMAHFAALLDDGAPVPTAPAPLAQASAWAQGGAEAPQRTAWPHPFTGGPGTQAPTTQGRTQAAPGAGHAAGPVTQPVAAQPHTQPHTQPGVAAAASDVGATEPAQASVAAGPGTASAEAAPRAADVPSTAQPVAKASGTVTRLLVAAGAAMLALGAAAWFMFKPAPGDGAKADAPTSASTAAPSASTSAVNPAPPPPPGPAQPATTPPAITPVPNPVAPLAVQPPVAQEPAVPTSPVAATPVRSIPAPAKPSAATPAPRAAAAGGDKAGRCSDLLQKASLEPLSPSETSFLKTECR